MILLSVCILLNSCYEAVLIWVLFVGMGMFVVGVDWLLDVYPSDTPDGSSRVLVPNSVDSHGFFVVVGVALFVDCWIGVSTILHAR